MDSNKPINKKIRLYRQKKDFVMVRYLLKVRNWLISEDCF